MVAGICNVEQTAGGDCDAARAVEFGFGCGDAIACKALTAGARDDCEYTCWRVRKQAMARCVCGVEVARCIAGETCGLAQRCGGADAAGGREDESCLGAAGECGQHA